MNWNARVSRDSRLGREPRRGELVAPRRRRRRTVTSSAATTDGAEGGGRLAGPRRVVDHAQEPLRRVRDHRPVRACRSPRGCAAWRRRPSRSRAPPGSRRRARRAAAARCGSRPGVADSCERQARPGASRPARGARRRRSSRGRPPAACANAATTSLIDPHGMSAASRRASQSAVGAVAEPRRQDRAQLARDASTRSPLVAYRAVRRRGRAAPITSHSRGHWRSLPTASGELAVGRRERLVRDDVRMRVAHATRRASRRRTRSGPG